MDWRNLADDIRTPVTRFVEAAGPARFDVTSFDLNMVLPNREISPPEIEAVMAYLAEHGVQLSHELDDI